MVWNPSKTLWMSGPEVVPGSGSVSLLDVSSGEIFCNQCGMMLHYHGNYVGVWNLASGAVKDGRVATTPNFETYCHKCAGYSYDNNFENRENWIRQSVPDYASVMPVFSLADWLEEQNRKQEADYLRLYRSGR